MLQQNGVCVKSLQVTLQCLVPFAQTTLQNPVLTQRELRCIERFTPGQGRIACFVLACRWHSTWCLSSLLPDRGACLLLRLRVSASNARQRLQLDTFR
jgi:hypothetical protein